MNNLGRKGLLLLPLACYDPTPYDQCYHHCWESEIDTGDIQDNVSPMGAYDSTCTQYGGGTMWPPLPTELTMPGRECFYPFAQDDHDLLKLAIAAKLDDDLGSLSQAETEDAEELLGRIAGEIAETCASWLTCGFRPGTCDLDGNPMNGDQSCTIASAESVCATYVLGIADSALDLQTGPQVPVYSGTGQHTIESDNCDFVPEFATTGGEPPGADDTGPFGDITSLVSCSPQTSCTVDAELLWNIQLNFAEFYEEEIVLSIEASGSPCNTHGAKIIGLDSGEDAKALADELDLHNNDFITSVEGINLTSSANAFTVVEDLQTTTDAVSMTVKRASGMTCQTVNYTLTPINY
jgi:hypothetical protein